MRPVLARLGGEIHHAGGTGSGAAVKLMVNALFGIQASAMAELIGFARKLELDVEKAIEILNATPVSSPAAKMIQHIEIGATDIVISLV